MPLFKKKRVCLSRYIGIQNFGPYILYRYENTNPVGLIAVRLYFLKSCWCKIVL